MKKKIDWNFWVLLLALLFILCSCSPGRWIGGNRPLQCERQYQKVKALSTKNKVYDTLLKDYYIGPYSYHMLP